MDDKPKTLFALKVSRDKRFLQDMWYMFILFSILAAAALVVSLIQYAFCNSLYLLAILAIGACMCLILYAMNSTK